MLRLILLSFLIGSPLIGFSHGPVFGKRKKLNPQQERYVRAHASNGAGSSASNLISANNYIGIDVMWPNLKKDWKSEKPWVGFNGQLGFLQFGMGYGSALKLKSDGQVHREQGRYAFLGARIDHPLRIVRNFFVLEPEIGLTFTYGQLDDVPDADAISLGLGITPGLGLKVGPVKVVAKYNMQVAIPINDKNNAWKGGMRYPIIGLYLETGWGLMNPRKISSGGIITSVDVSRSYVGTENQNGTWYDVYREVTTYTDHSMQATVHDVRPYWFIYPKANSSEIYTKDKRKTMMYGGGAGFRMGIFGGEGFYTQGKLGFGSTIDPELIQSAYGTFVDLSGYREAHQWGAMAGVDMVAMLTNWFVKFEDQQLERATRFTRFMFMWGMGETTFTGPAVYNEEAALQQIANITSILGTTELNNRLFPMSTNSSRYRLFSFRFEMGMVSVGFERYRHKDAEFATTRELTLAFQIPPARVIRAAFAQSASRKFARQQKRGGEQ